MIRIPRIMNGYHLLAMAVALIVFGGTKLNLYGPLPPLVALFAVGAAFLFVRPGYELTPDGLHFVMRVFWLLPIRHNSIPHKRIRCVRIAWDKEMYTTTHGNVTVMAPVTYLGVFLDFIREKSGRKTSLCLTRPRDIDEARETGREYARALACPLKRR